MKKYRPPLTESEQKTLIELSKLNFSTFSESDVREEFLVELLKMLGYRKDLDYSVSREVSFPLSSPFLSVGSHRIRLDYLFSIRKQYFWLIDAKEGRCVNKNDPPGISNDSVGQAYFYSLHPSVNCRYFIVSNGWHTNLYERDALTDDYAPLLSIKNTELLEKFLDLDRYVGSTQILPSIKESILAQIDQVFAAEVRVERLDEFVGEVERRSAKARGKVQQAAAQSYFNNDSGVHSLAALEHEDLSEILYSLFNTPLPKGQLVEVSAKLIDRLTENRKSHTFKESFFWSKLVLESPYPVSHWYYPNVLHFLFAAAKEIQGPLYYGQRTAEFLLKEWLDSCLFGLSSRKELRYLWACERYQTKIVKQTALLFPFLREKITEVLQKQLFVVPEEFLPVMTPSHASVFLQVVENAVAYFRSQFLQKYYDKKRHLFKEALADQTYRGLIALSEQLDRDFGIIYQQLQTELGSEWSVFTLNSNLSSDHMTNAVLDILLLHKDQLGLLTDRQKERLQLMAEIGFSPFAEKLCTGLGIQYRQGVDPNIVQKGLAAFFDPTIDQLSLIFPMGNA